MTCDCDYAPKTFYCPLCRRDVCWCQGSYTDDGLEDLCDDCWCKVTHEWRTERVELLRRELAYWESGKAADEDAIDEILVRPTGKRWNMHQNGDVWVLSNNYRRPIDGRAYGRIWWSGMSDGVRQAWPANQPFATVPIREGTITDCARALVEAIT